MFQQLILTLCLMIPGTIPASFTEDEANGDKKDYYFVR
jgi:hypothetical protein